MVDRQVYVTAIALIISQQCLHLLQCIADDVSVYIIIYVKELCNLCQKHR